MSQPEDWGVQEAGPATPQAFAGRINDSLDALLSLHKGGARPDYAVAGTMWIDDTATPWLLYLYDGTSDILLGSINNSTHAITWISSAAYTLGSFQVFTSSGTWTKPDGCRAVLVEVVGPGGGGAGATGGSSECSVGGGGGAGEYARRWITSPGSSETVTVGTGGAGGAANATPQAGAAGSGNSSFGSHVSAAPGQGGSPMTTGTSPLFVAGGAGGNGGSGGTIICKGQPGSPGIRLSGTVGHSGNGAPGPFGGGGEGSVSVNNGIVGEIGAGGSGAASFSVAQRGGGNGGNGIVIVWEFY